jgi:hypothetical protein
MITVTARPDLGHIKIPQVLDTSEYLLLPKQSELHGGWAIFDFGVGKLADAPATYGPSGVEESHRRRGGGPV